MLHIISLLAVHAHYQPFGGADIVYEPFLASYNIEFHLQRVGWDVLFYWDGLVE